MTTAENSYTNLSVTNETSSDVEVYVTFGAAGGATQHPLTPSSFAFLTEVNKLQGKFTLAAGKTQYFDTKGGCFTGNVCFYMLPGCPPANATTFNGGIQGTSLAEFTLNPPNNAGETIDISCVNGINSYIEMNTGAGEGWNYGPDHTAISVIQNKALQCNADNPGVFPVNCTTCTGADNAPCPTLPVGPMSTKAVCTVNRGGRGGVVQVILRDVVALSLERADNQFAAFLNGEQVFIKSTEGNPSFYDFADLTDKVKSGTNELLLVGINWGGPYSFKGSINIYGDYHEFDETAQQSANGIVWSKSFQFQKP